MPSHIGEIEIPRKSPHFLKVRQAVRRFCADRDGYENCNDCVVGLSGGPDSLALVAALAAEEINAHVVVVDHGLQDSSAQVAARALAQAQSMGLRGEVARVEVVGAGEISGKASGTAVAGGLEAAARAARYLRLMDIANGRAGRLAIGGECRPVLVGHTLDDQAETVLMGLARGSGAASLSGMAPWTHMFGGIVGRPLLSVRRADTVGTCRELGLQPWDDPHNSNPSFTRVRIRREALPLLENILGGGVAEALARSGELLRADEAALTKSSKSALVQVRDADRLDIAKLRQLDAPILARVLRLWLREIGITALTYQHINAITALVTDYHGQGPVAVPFADGRRVQMASKGYRQVVTRQLGFLRLGIQNETGQLVETGGGNTNA